MAALGHVRETYWEGCGADRRKYVKHFRCLVSAIPTQKQETRARYLNVPVSTLSNYWSGRRVPHAKALSAMYQTLCRSLCRDEMPVSLGELERLRRSAASRVSREVNAASNISSPRPLAGAGMPASMSVPGSGAVPAPRPAADRHNVASSIIRQTLEALAHAQAAGNRRSVLGIAWSASKAMTAEELAATVTALDEAGSVDLAEAVLLGGRERTGADSMRLALALITAGRTEYAELVMRSALPPELL
ncbi:hypothetical protein OG756_15370 [Streptomyces sp. NBC_01310]|uniref:hypothetical protein n=1 Tax=Streptomyces sp. NBC_01310 TaxID=2903820 RepID=UPI0035B6A410|nr:hypothetical protein OG756_15370 [Streptomyces sp. NBC_01310]